MRSKKYISPWIIIGTSLLLTALVAFLGVVNYHRDKERMGRFLSEKGATLIRCIEAGAQTDVTPGSGGFADADRLQRFVERTAVQPDITHITIVDNAGIIKVHSQSRQVGERFLGLDELRLLAPSNEPEWRIVHKGGRTTAFEVYRIFSPFISALEQEPGRQEDSAGTLQDFGNLHYIFIGMNVTPFEQAMVQDRNHNMVMLAIILSLGLAGCVSLFWEQNYNQSRRLLEETRKMAAIGNLAAGIAHEVRNPLSSIRGYATYFGRLFETGSENRRAAELMAGEVDRINRVISELLEFATPLDLKFRQIKVMDLVEHSVRIVRQEAQIAGIGIIKKTAPGLPDLNVDMDRLTQVLLNFYINAIQAMDPGGTLGIQAFPRGGDIVIEVSDTGMGISMENQKQVFEPYFTTKKSGTGLGLAIALKIVENHGGSIQVKSEVNSGTTLSIILPVKRERGKRA